MKLCAKGLAALWMSAVIMLTAGCAGGGGVLSSPTAAASSRVQEAVPVSRGMRVTSSSEGAAENQCACNLTDGDKSTAWMPAVTGETVDEWITVDLVKVYDIDRIDFVWGLSRAVSYTVEASRGGVDYFPVCECGDCDPSQEQDTLTVRELGELSARFVRLRVRRIAPEYASLPCAVRELEVFGSVSADQSVGTESGSVPAVKSVVPTQQDVVIFGRHETFNELLWSGAVYEYQCTGKVACVILNGTQGEMQASVDGGEYRRFEVKEGTREYWIADDLADGTHTVRVMRGSDAWQPAMTVERVLVEYSGELIRGYSARPELRMEFIGDSITSAQGIAFCDGYACRTAAALGAEYHVLSLCGQGTYRNAGNNAAYKGALHDLYMCTKAHGAEDYTGGFDADVVVVNLGTNDGSALLADKNAAEIFDRMYLELLEAIHKQNPRAAIVCAYGQLGTNARIWKGIQSAVAAMREKYAGLTVDVCHFQSRIDAAENEAGHPGVKSHERDALELTAKIRKMLGK